MLAIPVRTARARPVERFGAHVPGGGDALPAQRSARHWPRPQRRLATWTGVAALHVALIFALWHAGPVREAPARVTRVDLIPIATPRPEPPPEPPRPLRPMRHDILPSPPAKPTFEPLPPLVPNAAPETLVLNVPTEPAPAVPDPAPIIAAPTPDPAPAGVPVPVTPPRFDAAYLHNPAPPYPTLSRRRGEQGRVLLRVLVSPDGTAERVEVAKSSGAERLDQSALETVRRWKFVPAQAGARAVAAWVFVPIAFSLEG